jgi:hypothetical protein
MDHYDQLRRLFSPLLTGLWLRRPDNFAQPIHKPRHRALRIIGANVWHVHV